ncbi:hypothetical protein [Streptosporangium lutulentum]|uniref:FXSXX-COOH protein n=1 Tax=Streptosporangium lutulentum TaxID=1461250 RepID=A0ABT9Q3I2_9ACTN|nr:hypothetical protein [Streptosporangium lutulentum]MDP9840888.1 hypothetical protein [Streptosporangium lutulentum]
MHGETTGEFGTGLVDVTGLSLSQIGELGEPSHLVLVLQRFVEEADSDPTAEFQLSL